MDRTVTINWLDDETVSIQVDNTEITYACHGEHGWAGVDMAISTASKVAEALGAEVRTEGTPNR